MKFIQWQKKWLEVYQKPRIKHHTYTIYCELFDKHVNPVFADKNLDEISADDVQCFLHKKLCDGNLKNGGGLSTSTVNLFRALVNCMFECAFQNGFISQNPCKKIRRVVGRQKQVTSFSRKEQKEIEAHCMKNTDRYLGVLMVLYTGLRIGELLSLTWDDVDLKKRVIYVRKTVYRAKDNDGVYKRFIDTPKSQSSQRIIPIAKQLHALMSLQKNKQKSKYVICDKHGMARSVRGYQSSFATLQKNIGIVAKNFHALRHTFATRAIECGVDIKTLSELMGHQNTQITLDKYGHSLFDTKKKAVDLLEKSCDPLHLSI